MQAEELYVAIFYCVLQHFNSFVCFCMCTSVDIHMASLYPEHMCSFTSLRAVHFRHNVL
jgi:hypothetical protein